MNFFQAGDDGAATPRPVDESLQVTDATTAAAASTAAVAVAAAVVVVEKVPVTCVRAAGRGGGGGTLAPEATAATGVSRSFGGLQQGGDEMETSPTGTTMMAENRTLVVYPPECLLHM